MQLVDREVGALLDRLDEEGLTDSTIVFFIGDHGRCHIRGKQFLYDGGIRIPMIMRWPGKVAPEQVSDDLVMSIDICATILEAAGVRPPVPLHGKSLLGKNVKDRKCCPARDIPFEEEEKEEERQIREVEEVLCRIGLITCLPINRNLIRSPAFNAAVLYPHHQRTDHTPKSVSEQHDPHSAFSGLANG